MTHLLGPDPNSRFVFSVAGSGFRNAVGKPGTVYTDAAGTVLADIAAYNPGTPETPGATISGSVVTVGTDALLPLFWFPDGVDTLYITVAGGALTRIVADLDRRVDDLTGGTDPTVVHTTGNQTVAGIKTFTSPPVIPDPTAPAHAVSKQYVDTATTAEVTARAAMDTVLAEAITTKADLVGGRVPTGQLPALAISDFLGVVGSESAMLALTGQRGDWVIRSDLAALDDPSTAILSADDATDINSWQFLSTPISPVTSINGFTGVVVLNAASVGAASATDPRLSDTRTPTDGSVTTAKVADGAITSAKLADGTIVDADIASGAAISLSKLSGLGTAATRDAPSTGDAASAQVVLGADSRLTDARSPADGAVTTAKLADGAVTSAKISDGTIVDADVSSAAAISPSKIGQDPRYDPAGAAAGMALVFGG